jgi:hypothetical protein
VPTAFGSYGTLNPESSLWVFFVFPFALDENRHYLVAEFCHHGEFLLSLKAI